MLQWKEVEKLACHIRGVEGSGNRYFEWNEKILKSRDLYVQSSALGLQMWQRMKTKGGTCGQMRKLWNWSDFMQEPNTHTKLQDLRLLFPSYLSISKVVALFNHLTVHIITSSFTLAKTPQWNLMSRGWKKMNLDFFFNGMVSIKMYIGIFII